MCVIIVYLQCKTLRTPTALQQRKTVKVELAFVCFILLQQFRTLKHDTLYIYMK